MEENLSPELLTGCTKAFLEMYDHVKGIAAWIKDKHGVFRWANQELIELVDRYKNEKNWIIGKTDYELHNEELAAKYIQDDSLVLKGIPLLNKSEYILGGNHITKIYTTTKLPIYNLKGEIIGTLGVAQTRNQESIQIGENTKLIMEYIIKNYKTPITTEKLTNLTKTPIENLEKAFLQDLKITISEFTTEVRLNNAIQDLNNREIPPAEIAKTHGFTDLIHFIENLKQKTGHTPTEYRRVLFKNKKSQENGKFNAP
jgi:AraC-like DNA-binding protein